MIAYPAMLDVPRELVDYVSRLLAARRHELGTRRGRRALGTWKQALFLVIWFRKREDIALLAQTSTNNVWAAVWDGSSAWGNQTILTTTAPSLTDHPMTAGVAFEAKSGDLLAVRFDSHSAMTLDGGDVESNLEPKLITFHQDGDGEWRMVAIGMFEVTAKLAKDAPCIAPKAK